MKKKVKKIWILCLMFILMWTISGCNNSKAEERAEQEEVQLTEEPIQNAQEPEVTSEPITPEVSAEPEKQEVLTSENMITYGDKVNISYTKTTQEFQWEYTGTQEFQVATTSVQFQNEFDDSEEAAMKQVEEAIGKTVGDTFTLWYEGGDGRYGYEYTIVEVKSQNPDIAEYGDKLLADYRMTHYGVETCEGEKTHTGQLDLHLINTNAFFAIELEGEHYSTRTGDGVLKKILGKTIEDEFWVDNIYWEKSFTYQFTIKEINKAVKYGDTIVAEVRETNTIDAKSIEEYSQKEEVLDLIADGGVFSLDGGRLSLENSRAFYKELNGKKAGDRVVFVRETREKREIYNIMILGVTACESEDAEDMEVLFVAEEDEMCMFYQYFEEYEDYFEYYPHLEVYSKPILIYITIYDRKEKMVYEYYSYDYAVSYNLADKYEYIEEYDEKGQLVKETILGSRLMPDGITEYKYDEKGRCIECIIDWFEYTYKSYLYYDDMGNLIKYDTGTWIEEFIYEGDRLIKSICYYENGEISVCEYNEWGVMKNN